LDLLSSLRTSLFLNVAFVDVNDNVCNTCKSNDGDYGVEKLIDDRPDAVNAVDGGYSKAGDFTMLDNESVFFPASESNLPFLFFGGVLYIDSLVVLDMVSYNKNDGCLQLWR
jgi:hypothetical protein